MAKGRKLKLDNKFEPLPTRDGDEIFRNGYFKFNITRIMEDIVAGKLEVTEEPINVSSWSRLHSSNSVNENHLSSVDINKTVLQAEIRAGAYNMMKEEAAAAGFYKPELYPDRYYPRLQILTIEEILNGKQLSCPHSKMAQEVTFKKAERITNRDNGEQGTIF